LLPFKKYFSSQKIFTMTSSKIQYATKRLINSVWTVAYVINDDNTVTIVSYDRDNIIGYTKEKELPRAEIVETGERMATTLLIQEYTPFRSWPDTNKPYKEFSIANRKHIFDYTK
jgi:hypothetical protein